MLQHVHDILFKALGDRIRLIRNMGRQTKQLLGFHEQKGVVETKYCIGLLRNIQHFLVCLIEVKCHDTVAASAFVSSGEKSELRRLKTDLLSRQC